MEDDLEAMAMHPPAGVTGGDVRQAVGGLEAKAVPEMAVVARREFRPGVGGTAHAHGRQAGDLQIPADPARQILVGGDRQPVVEKLVVQGRDRRAQGRGQGAALAARKWGPARVQGRPHPSQKTVAMEPARAVTHGQDGNLAGGLEGHGGQVVESVGHRAHLTALAWIAVSKGR